MLLRRPLIVIVGLITALTRCNAATKLLDSAFDKEAELLLELLHVPGISVAVVHNGKFEAKGYGFSQLPSTPATPDTLWFMGSTTKAFTAAAIGKIVRGETNITGLQWSTPLFKILGDDIVLSDEYASSHITLEDAMSHRSGLPRHDLAYGWNNASTTDVLRTMRHLPFSAQPRTRWQYNNFMFAAMGEVIHRLTGDLFEHVLKQWLWDPIGMRSTTFSIAEADSQDDRLARGYYWDDTHYVPDRWIDIIPAAGAGAIISSVNDYILWAHALLQASTGELNHTSPINKRLFEALTTPRSIIADIQPGASAPTYALGWMIGVINGKHVIAHSGGLSGFGSFVYLVPEEGLGFVAAGNTQGSSSEVQAALFVEILRRIGVIDEIEDHEDLENAKRLFDMPEASESNSQARQRTQASTNTLPLPGKIADYLGLYAHPAYGTINITHSAHSSPISPASSPSSQKPLLEDLASRPTLLITPSTRTWDFIYTATHTTHTTFDLTIHQLHGPAPSSDAPCSGASSASRNLECRNEVASEDMGEIGSMAFERGKDGEVERVGLELEPEVVRWVREEERDWREGMIWFVRIES